jgi:ATP-dependent DNA ligase
MRCYSLDDKRRAKLSFPVTAQPKYNGCRCMAYNLPNGDVRLMTRGGKDYVLPHVQEELRGRIPAGYCLDGELYVHGMSLQKIRRLILTPTPDSPRIRFVCYDMTKLPPDGEPWLARYDRLAQWFRIHQDVVFTCQSDAMEAHSLKDIEEYHDFWVSQGYEGCIVRVHSGKYKLAAKNTEILKYKKFQDSEFRVVNWGVGKDGVILYVCETEDGKPFEVRPMGDENERAELLKTAGLDVGKLLTVKYQELSDDGVPIFPVGIGFRPAEDMD